MARVDGFSKVQVAGLRVRHDPTMPSEIVTEAIARHRENAAQQSLKQATQNEKAVADLVEQAADDLGATTPTRGNIVNIKA